MDFEKQVAKHKNAIYRQMVRVCGNADDAEDVLIEAIVNAYRAAGQLEDTKHFRAWLTTIAKRVCFRMKSGRHIKDESLQSLQDIGVDFPSNDPTVQETLEMEVTQTCVIDAYQSLPAIYKEVYRMREIEGCSAEETAKALRLSVPTVKSRLHRARIHVRDKLDSQLMA